MGENGDDGEHGGNSYDSGRGYNNAMDDFAREMHANDTTWAYSPQGTGQSEGQGHGDNHTDGGYDSGGTTGPSPAMHGTMPYGAGAAGDVHRLNPKIPVVVGIICAVLVVATIATPSPYDGFVVPFLILSFAVLWFVLTGPLIWRNKLALVISILVFVPMIIITVVDFVQLVQDVPYFNDPMRVTLTDVDLERRESTDDDGDTTVSYYVSGYGDDGDSHRFSISQSEYSSCKAIVGARTNAVVSYLPHSNKTMDVSCMAGD